MKNLLCIFGGIRGIKPLVSILALVLTFSLIPSNKIHATHAMGVDLNYTYAGNNQWEFILNFYRDCAGVAAPSGVTLSLFSPGACGASQSITLTRVGTGTEVSPLCPDSLSNSSCRGGSLPGVEQYVYIGVATINTACTDWLISFDHCCRNAAISNLNNPSAASMYVQALLNNTPGLDNSSPRFTALPVPYICANQTFCYNHGAIDPDGDSLAYRLVNALQTGGAAIPYNAPYSPTYPITDISSSVQFDSLTGTMCVVPTGPQVCVVTIEVLEYRNGTVIGSTMRDLQIVVQTCANSQPLLTPPGIFTASGGIIQDTNRVAVCPGDFLQFRIRFDDANAGDSIFLTNNLGTAIPTASWSSNGANPAIANVSWTPTFNDIGIHNFVVTVQDNGCPFLGSVVYLFQIEVLQNTDAGPDRFYCPGGGPIQLNAQGGTVFNWVVLNGDGSSLSCTNCANPQATPNVTSTYEVTSNLGGGCKSKDTVIVNRVPDFTLSTSADDTICQNGSTTLTAGGSPGTFAPYSFSWSPNSYLSNANSANPLASPPTTQDYVVTATASNGCQVRDTVTVEVIGVAPLVEAGLDQTICPGTSTGLTGSIVKNCGIPLVNCTGTVDTTTTVGAGSSTTDQTGPHYISSGINGSIRRQYIYTATELAAAGMSGGRELRGIAFNYTALGAAPNSTSDVQIKLGCFNQPQFSNNTFIFGLTTVKNSFTFTPVVGWNYLSFDNPYVWDGTSNLIVEICTSLESFTNPSTLEYTSTPAAVINNNYLFNAACSQATGTLTDLRPNVRFTYCQEAATAYTYAWTPSTSLTNPNTLTPTASPAQTTTYLLTVSDGNCEGTDIVTVNIDSTVYATAIASDHTPCVGDTIQLSTTMTGSPLPPPLACGANGTTCTTTPHVGIAGGGGSASPDFGPFYGLFVNQRFGNKVQYIFTAAELQAGGMPYSGTITEVSLNVTTNEASQWRDFEIKMGCTVQSEYGNSNFITTGLTTVFTAASYNTQQSWNTWQLTTPYDWDGTSNLVVEFCARTWTGSTNPESVQYTNLGSNFRCMYRHDVCNCSACSQTTGTRSINRANMLFTICDAPAGTFTYSWSPATNLTSTVIPNPSAENVAPPQVYTVTVAGGLCTVQDTVNLVQCIPLPLDDLHFGGEKMDDQALLTWETWNEQDVDYFQVLHSQDGENFTVVGKHNSLGNNPGMQAYELIHPDPVPGVNFYRLRQVDQNGSTHLTETISLYFGEEEEAIRVYPNPVQPGQSAFVEYFTSKEQEGRLQVMDIAGRVITDQPIALGRGLNRFTLDISKMSVGAYFVRISGEYSQKVSKLSVMK